MKRAFVFLFVAAPAVLAGVSGQADEEDVALVERQAAEAERTPATVVGPGEGEIRWFAPESAEQLGDGSEIEIKIDYERHPHASLGAFIQKTASSGIPVHAHVRQAEMIYVIGGVGIGLVGDGREEVPLEAGSVVYVPERAWHGFRNTDPDDPLELLIVTRPTEKNGVIAFFRNAATRPGETPLDLSPEQMVELLKAHGMELPPPDENE